MKKQQLVVSFPSYKLGTFHNPLPDIGRNEPCPCKSGKKYKRCCGLKQAGMIAAKCVDVSKRNLGYTPNPGAVSYQAGQNSITIAPASDAGPEASPAPAPEAAGIKGLLRKGLTLIRKGGAK